MVISKVGAQCYSNERMKGLRDKFGIVKQAIDLVYLEISGGNWNRIYNGMTVRIQKQQNSENYGVRISYSYSKKIVNYNTIFISNYFVFSSQTKAV